MDPTTTPDVQPQEVTPESQGAPTPDPGLYPDLTALPEDVRDIVTPLLKQMEGNITKKFTEAAEYRKQWEPYQELGLNDVEPDDLKDLLAFREIAGDEDRFKEWLTAVSQELGLNSEQSPQGDPSEGGDLQQTIAQALDQRLSPIEKAFQASQEAQALAQAESLIDSKLKALKGEHGDFDDDTVCQLALAYEGEDAIERGYADYERLVGVVEKNFLDGKLRQPETPEQGGRPATQAQEITSFEDAKVAAKAAFQRAMQT